MSELIGSAVGGYNTVTKEYPVADTVTVSDGDMVYLVAGRVSNAAIDGKTLLGNVTGGQSNDLAKTVSTGSQTTTGNTAGTVKVLVTVGPNNKYVMKNDNLITTFIPAHVGTSFDITGLTGAQLVDTSTTLPGLGQVECIEFGYKGDNTKGVFIINEHKYKVNA